MCCIVFFFVLLTYNYTLARKVISFLYTNVKRMTVYVYIYIAQPCRSTVGARALAHASKPDGNNRDEIVLNQLYKNNIVQQYG